MHGKEETNRCPNRRYQADAGRSGGGPKGQGSQGSEEYEDKAAQSAANKDKGPQEQQLVRDAKTEDSKASEDRTAKESAKAADLHARCGFKAIQSPKPGGV